MVVDHLEALPRWIPPGCGVLLGSIFHMVSNTDVDNHVVKRSRPTCLMPVWRKTR